MSFTFADLFLNAATQINLHVGPVLHPPIRRKKAPDLTRDQRRDCQLLFSLSWSYTQIHNKFGYTLRQIQTACSNEARATLRKRGGRPPLLT